MKPVVAANGHGEGGGGDDDSDNGGYSGGHAVREGVCPRLVFPREDLEEHHRMRDQTFPESAVQLWTLAWVDYLPSSSGKSSALRTGALQPMYIVIDLCFSPALSRYLQNKMDIESPKCHVFDGCIIVVHKTNII